MKCYGSRGRKQIYALRKLLPSWKKKRNDTYKPAVHIAGTNMSAMTGYHSRKTESNVSALL